MNGRWAEIVRDARQAAVGRHPSVQTTGAARRRFGDAVAGALAASGVPFPVVAGAILDARGRSGLDVATFARRAGVSPTEVMAAEAGEVARALLPKGLRAFVPR